MATRALVSDSKPTATPSLSSNDIDIASKDVLQGTNTDNYSQAAANAAKTSANETDRPGLGRQQSWKMSDKKREVTEQMFASKQPNHMGYTSHN